jgi:plasmid stabilization system protein ParE
MIPIVTEQAVDDLFAIFSHRSETNAQIIVDEIRERIADLEHFPLFGRSRDDLKKGLRAFFESANTSCFTELCKIRLWYYVCFMVAKTSRDSLIMNYSHHHLVLA